MTANFGAVGFSNKDKNSITNESHWTNEDEPGLSVYEKSKLLAEKAAWDFVENEKYDSRICHNQSSCNFWTIIRCTCFREAFIY